MNMNCNVYPRVEKLEQKIVIFDSPDGTGKTNIAHALARELKVPYFRMDSQHDNWRKGRFKDALEFDQTYIASYLRQTNGNVIIDRAYPSEWVYSKVYKRETNENVLEQVDDEFARMGAYIIVPLRRDYTKARKDEVVKPEKLKPLHDKYLEFCQWTKCNTIQIYVDDFGDDLEKELPLLLKELKFDRIVNPALHFNSDVILQRPFAEKDVSDLYKEQSALAGRSSDIKNARKPR